MEHKATNWGCFRHLQCIELSTTVHQGALEASKWTWTGRVLFGMWYKNRDHGFYRSPARGSEKIKVLILKTEITEEDKSAFPDRESNPGRGGESAES